MMPLRAARISAGSAATSAAWAAVLSPLEMASSTVRNELRMRVRRALLISVRCAILRVAFLADFVLAIDVPLLARGGKSSGGVNRRRMGDAYSGVVGRRQRARWGNALVEGAWRPSRHPLGPHPVVSGDDCGTVGGGKGSERR